MVSDAWVVCLCADWCGVCREWREPFAEAAAQQPQSRFAWVDIEDEADAIGDFDIETFPTLLVSRGEQVLFLGPVQPSPAQLSRLLTTLLSNVSDSMPQPPQAIDLLARLRPILPLHLYNKT